MYVAQWQNYFYDHLLVTHKITTFIHVMWVINAQKAVLFINFSLMLKQKHFYKKILLNVFLPVKRQA